MSGPYPKRVRGVSTAVHADRVAMINGRFDLPQETVDAMGKIREHISKAATECMAVFDGLEFRDEGRITAFIDSLQAAKNIGCDAVILPHGPSKK